MKFTGERFIPGQAMGDIIVEHLQRYITVAELVKGKDVLDSACGEGYGSFILSEQAKSVVGIDISADAIANAGNKYIRNNLLYKCASIEKLPLADQSVDVVISFETIEHVNETVQNSFLLEIKRVLKPSGMLIMSSPDKLTYSDLKNYSNPYHVREFYFDEFKNFLKPYFKNLSFYKQGIENKRIGVIEKVCSEKENNVKLIDNINMSTEAAQYIIALCSDIELDINIKKMESIMPFIPESPVRLFLDFGNGFNEDDTILGIVEKKNNIIKVRFEFDSDKNIESLRFDPVENSGCVCKILKINSDIGAVKIRAVNSNSFSNDQEYKFLNCDPQFQIEGNFLTATYLEIEYEFSVINVNQMNDLLILQLNDVLVERDNVIVERDNVLNKLSEIQNSHGYKLLKKYYRIRDFFFPIGSNRKLIIKNGANVIRNFKRISKFMNKENISKIMQYIKRGNFRQLLIKLDSKIKSVLVDDINNEHEINYINNILNETINELNDISNENIIDIIIPIYNAYEFTKKCIESVYKNTDVNYNLYLINDCSTDPQIGFLLDSLKSNEKPKKLKNLIIILNEENLGFIKSVNKGMSLALNHVILLNTDTEVPEQWLSRMIKPILQDIKIASITPFSNCATICSFPEFCKDNELPEGMTVNEIDHLFKKYGGNCTVEVPTGIGFCMLLNKDCLKNIGFFDAETYGKGYGEENDWCMRAYKAGYKNVMVTNLFVYHKHGVSFAQHIDKAKETRILENLEKLNQRYPEYTYLVDQFIAQDVLKEHRAILQSAVLAEQLKEKEGILFINHSLGGGTKVYQDNLISRFRNTKRIYSLELQLDYKTLILTDYNAENVIHHNIDLNQLDIILFKKILTMLNISLIYINQLVTYPVDKMIDLISNSEIKYTFFVHDFFAVCPSFNLINKEGNYCTEQSNAEICQNCLKNNLYKNVLSYKNGMEKDISKWRAVFSSFLEGAENVIAPSKNTANIVKSYYPKLNVLVREHSLFIPVKETFSKRFVEKEYITIAAIGSISEIKGSKILYEIVEKIKAKKLPIKIKVIGITNLQNSKFISDDGNFEITGPYDNTQISDLLAQHEVSAVIIPAIWPETYSYTTTEAIQSGYPVISFNIGAPAERIKEYNCGWVIDEISAGAVVDLLEKLLLNRELIFEKIK